MSLIESPSITIPMMSFRYPDFTRDPIAALELTCLDTSLWGRRRDMLPAVPWGASLWGCVDELAALVILCTSLEHHQYRPGSISFSLSNGTDTSSHTLSFDMIQR